MKRKILALTAAAVMAFGLFAMTGCGSSSDSGSASASGSAASSDESDLAYVQDKGTLIVGITDFAPMDYKDDDGEWIGFDADMAKAYAESIGVDVEFIEINWDSKEMELENKNIDCIWNGMTLTDGVKKAMGTTNAYCNNAQVVVVNSDKASGIKTAEDCAGLAFAVEGGSAGAQAAADNGFDYIEVETQADAVMEVASGTADACIIDLLMAGAMVGEGTSYPDLTYTVSLTEEEYGVGVRTGSDLVESINEFFKTSYDDGTTEEIAEKYGTQESIIAQ